ncbi:hypothetical protein Tco_0606760 [Tanacetum coccineum]
MANLKYSDKHNMVAFLKKPNESVGFTKVVDFLKGTSLKYALTHNPTIYDSLVKQFWQTATVRTLANGTQQLVASIDSKEINSLEKELKDTKQTLGNVVVKLGEESEDQGRKIQDIDDDPLVSLVRESMKDKSTDFVTPTKVSGEAQEEEISPTILKAAKTLSKVTSQGVSKEKSTDKGKRYRMRASPLIQVTASKRGQREGKALMIEEDIQATHKTKEQMRQEEAGLEEAIKLQA